MKQLSFIVPVFNVAPYLSKCLNSLIAQKLDPEEYEIIIINDGSTDESRQIAGEFAGMYNNIQVFDQANNGLSATRNSGFIYAPGKYIQFVDSDDFLEANVLYPLLVKMEKENLDILRFNYQYVNEQYEVFQPYKNSKKSIDYRDSITDGTSFLTERLGYACYVPQFIFRSELIFKEENHFKKGIYFEDVEWTPRILVQAKRVTSVNIIVYNYLMRQGSITKQVDDSMKRKLLTDKLFLIDSLLEQQNQQSDKRWYQGMITETVVTLMGDIAIHYYKESVLYISELQKKRIFPLSFYNCPIRKKIRICVINLCPHFYCWLVDLKVKIRTFTQNQKIRKVTVRSYIKINDKQTRF